MESEGVRGTIPEIVRNDENLYEGNLIHYFRIVFNEARNLTNPYHNFRHMFHVLWLCYQACLFYKDKLSREEMRELLIAAMFHDFDHSGKFGNDDLNIALAIRGLKKHLLVEDEPLFLTIARLIVTTEYPFKAKSSDLSLAEAVLRDADLSQSFTPAWIQQVVFGLASEWNEEPVNILAKQKPFLETISPVTEWGRKMFPQADIDEKIAEAQELLQLLR